MRDFGNIRSALEGFMNGSSITEEELEVLMKIEHVECDRFKLVNYISASDSDKCFTKTLNYGDFGDAVEDYVEISKFIKDSFPNSSVYTPDEPNYDPSLDF